MEIKKYYTKYHKFILVFPYDKRAVGEIKKLQQEVGWKEISFYSDEKIKGWVFSDMRLYDRLCSIFGDIKQAEEEYKEQFVEPEEEVVEIGELSSEIDIPTLKPLFPFQKQAVDFVGKVGGKALLAMDMGVGKTATAIGYACFKRYGRVLIICPASVKENWKREIKAFSGVEAKIITDEDPGAWEIINYDQLKKFYPYLSKQTYDLIICDECFPYETKILTDEGYFSIGEIVENKLDLSVLSCNSLSNVLEWKKITNYYKYKSKPLFKIKHEKGEIICTANHKIYTDSGYKEAVLLRDGENLRILREEVYNIQKREINTKILQPQLCSEGCNSNASCPENIKEEKSKTFKEKMPNLWDRIFCPSLCKTKKILWDILFGEMEDETTMGNKKQPRGNKEGSTIKNRDKRPSCIYKNDKNEQRPKIQGESTKKLFGLEGKKPNLFTSWGEWEINQASNYFSEINEITNRIFHFYEKSKREIQKLTDLLQSRFSDSRKENCDRSRWVQPQNKEVEVFRQEKDFSTELSRVVSVEILEPGSFRQPEVSRGKNQSIYDIEVADNHNYFADGVLVSNSHALKNKQAQRTKVAFKVLKRTTDALFLTGTPIMNRPIEIYTTLNYIRPTNYWSFCMAHCGAKKTSWGWDLNGASNLDLLRKKMFWMHKKSKEEVLPELPDKTINILETALGNKKEYQRVLKDFRQWLIDKDLSLGALYAEALTKANYLKQVVVENKNIEEIIDSFLENGKKLVVFSQYKGIVNNLYAKYAEKSVKLTGGTPSTERQSIIDRFQQQDGVKIFFATLKAGGVGITLTAADTVIFTDLDWVPANHRQAEDRCHRIGQKNNVNVYYLITKNTIEEDIWAMLKRKEVMINKIMSGQENVRKVHIKSLLKKL
jgi:superfamily II DNA or RNA helicase